MGRAFGTEVLYTREGGSGPQADLAEILDAPVVFLGVGLPDDRIHAPNEKADIEFLLRGAEAAAYLWADLAVDLGALTRAGHRMLASLTLARGDLDRAAERREDAAWFDAAWAIRRPACSSCTAAWRARAPATAAEVAPGTTSCSSPRGGDVLGVRVLLAVDDGDRLRRAGRRRRATRAGDPRRRALGRAARGRRRRSGRP